MMISRISPARLALPLAAALLFSSCSSVADFVVVNETGLAVEVQYVFKERFATHTCCPLGERPQRKPAKDLGADAPWTPLEEDEYVYNPSAARMTVVLRAGDALRVARLNNYAGHGAGEDESFTLRSVRVEGDTGPVFYEGLRAQTAFARVNSGLYALTYR